MFEQNSAVHPYRTPDKKRNPAVAWVVVLGIGLAIFWAYNRSQDREAQRRREVMREVNWVITDDGVKMYKTHPEQNLNQRLKEIDNRYRRPIWQNVPEDRSGKGTIIIRP